MPGGGEAVKEVPGDGEAILELEQQVVGAARTVRGGTGGRPRRPVSVVLLMILADKGDSGLGSSRQCCLREGG